MITVIKRRDAIRQGLTRYFTGKPCRRGHLSERFCSDKSCVSCKSFQSKNWRQDNLERTRQMERSWYKRNIKNKIVSVRNWQVNNPAACKAIGARRRAKELNATPSWSEASKIKQLYEASSYLTLLTGIIWNVDHEVPLKHTLVSGLHVYSNLQLLPARDNFSKGNKFEPMIISSG